MKITNDSGITLVALIITIIVLLILAGVTLNLTLGENGLIKRAEGATQDYTKSEVKEELEMKISELYIQKKGKQESLTKQDIFDKIKGEAIILEFSEQKIEGEYKEHNFIIDENNKVIVGDKLVGEKPKVIIKNLVEGNAEEVQIQVIATTTDGDIQSIEPMNVITLKTENSVSDKIYEITRNGEYRFKVKGSNGRIVIEKIKVENVIEVANSLIEAIEPITTSGVQTVRVNGILKSGTKEKKTYGINVIYHKGNITLDGVNPVEGVQPNSEKVYEFGSANDVATSASDNAKNTVVLKIDGDLIIEEGAKLTTIKNSQYGGPKGLIIYCTGKIVNKGTISMTARGAKVAGENVYLWKNSNNTWEYVPATGATGGASVSNEGHYYGADSWYRPAGKQGNNGTLRQTGGGGSGASATRDGYNIIGTTGIAKSGAGGTGTSYSGGTGGGRMFWW